MTMIDMLQFVWLTIVTGLVGYQFARLRRQALSSPVKAGVRMLAKLAATREQFKSELAALHSPDVAVRLDAAKRIIARRAAERERTA